MLAPEFDPQFTPELKERTKGVLAKSGLTYAYIDFPRLAHGFATRGDREDDVQREGLEKAMCDFIDWANKQFKL